MKVLRGRVAAVAVIAVARLGVAVVGAVDVVLVASLLDGEALGRWFVVVALAFLIVALADGGHGGSLVRTVAEGSPSVRRDVVRALASAALVFVVVALVVLSGPAVTALERIELVTGRGDVGLSVALAAALLLRRLATDVARGARLDTAAALLAGASDRVAVFVALVMIHLADVDATVRLVVLVEVACLVGAVAVGCGVLLGRLRRLLPAGDGSPSTHARSFVYPALWLDAVVALGAVQLGVLITRVVLDDTDTGVFGLISRLGAMVALPGQVLIAYVPARVSVLVARGRTSEAQRLLRTTSAAGWYTALALTVAVVGLGTIVVVGASTASVGLAAAGLSVVAVGHVVSVGVGPVGRVLAAVHRDRWALAGSAIGLAVAAVGVAVLASAFGVIGALVGAALGLALNNLSQWWFLRRTSGLRSDGWSMMRPAEIRSSLRDFDRVAGDDDRPAV